MKWIDFAIGHWSIYTTIVELCNIISYNIFFRPRRRRIDQYGNGCMNSDPFGIRVTLNHEIADWFTGIWLDEK